MEGGWVHSSGSWQPFLAPIPAKKLHTTAYYSRYALSRIATATTLTYLSADAHHLQHARVVELLVHKMRAGGRVDGGGGEGSKRTSGREQEDNATDGPPKQ